jgi:hypothetical protein
LISTVAGSRPQHVVKLDPACAETSAATPRRRMEERIVLVEIGMRRKCCDVGSIATVDEVSQGFMAFGLGERGCSVLRNSGDVGER